MKKLYLVFCLGTILFAVGCVKTIDSSGKPQYSIDPNTGEAVQTGLDVGAATATGVSAVWPFAVPVSIILTALAGIWRKTNPVLAQATTEAQKYFDVTNSIVTGIESFKEVAPEQWEKLSEQLSKAIGPEVENVIRALRNLPPKI